MTRNNIHNKTKSRFIWALLLICMICTSLFTFVACDDSDDASDSDTNYTYSETNETLISNSYFSYGTADVKLTAYPKSSVTGWTKSTETDMTSSSSKYGVIDVSDEGWTNLVSKLYDDTYFLNFFKIKYDFEESDVKEALNSSTPTSQEIQDYIIENYFNSTDVFKYPENTASANQFKNPGTHEGAKDSKVYMLNNYLSKDNVGRGTAQKITSSSTITLNKGEYGKITVWVKTQNVSGLGVDYGANIRLTNTFNSTTQAEFGIYNIKDTEWTQYTIYVKADDVYSNTFTLVLGLGSDKFSATEGTVYFDDVEFEHVTAEEYADATKSQSVLTKYMSYGSDEIIKVDAADVKNGSVVSPVLYDMTMNAYLENNASNYKKAINVNEAVSADYTSTNKVSATGTVSGKRFGDSTASVTTVSVNDKVYPYSASAIKATLNKASYTISFNKNNAFTVSAKTYAYVEFYVKNQLNSFGSTAVTVDVFDISGNTVKKRAAIASITETGDEWVKVGLVVKNNFEEGDRQFYFDVVIGPTDVVTTDYAMDYASGEVLISAPTISTGSVNQYVSDGSTEKTENYDLYSLFSSSASGTVALYAGSASDFSETSETEDSYGLNVAPSDIGTIENAPAMPQGYKGIVSNHFYITDASEASTAINTSQTAGLINTKYLDNYDVSKYGNIASQLKGAYDSDEDIQPLMIYNASATSYGYIGESKTIAASAYAKFAVTLRVTDSATAFIYLVNTETAVKNVLTFDDFTVNSDIYGNAITDGKNLTGNNMQLSFKVTADMMDDDGWVTIEFYVATGATAKNVRLEIWNGSRDGATTSTGYVFVKDAKATTSGAFTEASNSKSTWTESGNPLYNVGESDFDELYIYKRVLTDTEKTFNSEQTDASAKVSYEANYVWAKSETMIYAVYNTIDPVEVDPYESQDDEEESTDTGCTAETDPATFWLSFSSILLGVALVAAMVMLVIKNVVRRRRANASDAKSHYKVTGRTRPQKKQADVTEKEDVTTPDDSDDIEETTEQTSDEKVSTENETNDEEKTLDEYVYGDVQDFGEAEKTENNESDND